MVRTTIELNSAPYNGEVMLYQTADGRVSIDVILVNESVWLTQDQLAILFERDKSVISRHIKNVFSEGELDPKVVVAKNAITTSHGAMPGKTQTHHLRWLPCQVQARHTIPHLGELSPKGISYSGLCCQEWLSTAKIQ